MNFSYAHMMLFKWTSKWESLCGPEGLIIWSANTQDFGLCFQELCLQIPILFILASASAYYFGISSEYVLRGKRQLYSIYFRGFIVFLMILVSMFSIYIEQNKKEKIWYLLCSVQVITWFTHFCFVLSLKYKRGINVRGPLFICVVCFLLFLLTVISVRSHVLIYRSKSIEGDYEDYSCYITQVSYLVLQILYGLTLIPGNGDIHSEIDENRPLLSELVDSENLGIAMENKHCLSILFFEWVYPLMKKGRRQNLRDAEDLYDLPSSINCFSIASKLENAVRCEDKLNDSTLLVRPFSSVSTANEDLLKEIPNKASLFKVLHRCFWKQFYLIGFLRLAADCSGFAGPMLLNELVSFIEDKSEDIKWGYFYATSLAFTSMISAMCDAHFNFLMAIVSLKLRIALVTTIYRKTLTVSETVLNSEFSSGEIINFMSTDTDRIVNSCASFHALWSIPFQFSVALYLLYTQVQLAFLPGVAFSVILIPINRYIAFKIGNLSTELMKQKDQRVKVVTEVLRGIKAVKIYVWEHHFISLINDFRRKELKYLKGRKYLDALCVYFWATTPVVISILTFATYVLMGNTLTPATAFTSIALFNMLISPLNAFPWVLNGVTEAWVSLKRIQKLQELPDLKLTSFIETNLRSENSDCDILIRKGSFSWTKYIRPRQENEQDFSSNDHGNDQIFILTDINLHIKKGEFIGVVGSVGSGKSSILSAVLGEMNMHGGEIITSHLKSGFGYVSQQPWLQRGTIRENILFGKIYDEMKYKSVLFACGLAEDINQLSVGDMTDVSDSGMTLSGGQKARIALARAVYQDKMIYLLDDVFSAVDVQVAKHIFQYCIMGLLKNKTKILSTHLVKYLLHADRIVVMENGTIKHEGNPADVMTILNVDLTESLNSSVVHQSLLHISPSLINVEGSANSKENERECRILDETGETGTVKLGVYTIYWKAIGHILGFSILASMFLMQISRNMADWWLSFWLTNSASSGNASNFTQAGREDYTIKYLGVYISFVFFNSIFTLIRAFLFAYGGVSAARRIHKSLLKSVLMAKSTFFDISPLGRILNRFSSDVYTIDDSLPFILNILLAQLFGLLGTVFVTIYGLPWICLVLVPLIPIYYWLQYTYRLTSSELKRISSFTLSPVYSHFNESLQGVTTIRAMRVMQRFKRENENYIEANIKAQFSSQAAARWLGLRLQFIGVAMIIGISFIAVIQHHYNVSDPGLVGLAMAYALSVTGALSGVVNAFTEVEREMIAVERVNQYIENVPRENMYCVLEPPFGWPDQGVIAFSNVVLKYSQHLAPSLSGIEFKTRPFEKIGVVGRTGSGKSSLIAAIFRLIELSSGSIYIDSINISQISLGTLRSRLFCIPQDPFLFSGTLRDNLDPLGEFTDCEIWSAINKVNLGETIRLLGGLENDVKVGGLNYSVGQKQLICLARAVLRNAKILCIDEATANVDPDTDRRIQKTLRLAFRKSTLITIAHRIETIMDSDRILVMAAGHLVEFDTPRNLLSNSSSYFCQLMSNE